MQTSTAKTRVVAELILRWFMRLAKTTAGVGAVFVVNYVVSLLVIGIPTLEVAMRPGVSVRFDSESWKSAAYDSGCRYPMAQELVASNRLLGKTTERVLVELGPPDRRWKQEASDILIYALAPQQKYPASSWLYPRMFPNIGSWELWIEVTNGVVARCKINGS